jgi:hypothetical protein
MDESLDELKRAVHDLRVRVAELERKNRVKTSRTNKFVNVTRQAVILLLGAIEDWGGLNRTIPSRRDRNK